ncbi:MAG: hypothetical protein WB621_25530, partial [Candidatus Acidiferrales bacterium]
MALMNYNFTAEHPLQFAWHRCLSGSATYRFRMGIALLACTFTLVAFTGTGAADNDRYLWKSVPQAQCKVDDKTPLTWNIYQTSKKKEANLVLVLIGHRYLALDIKAKIAYD